MLVTVLVWGCWGGGGGGGFVFYKLGIFSLYTGIMLLQYSLN